jgi:hypothetical protein
MDEDTEKKDQLIYSLINNRYRLELQRTNDLDGKASSIIGFVGVMVNLQAGIGTFLLSKIPSTHKFYIYLYLLFLSGIIFLICSILCGLMAYKIKRWKVVPDSDYLIQEYAKKDKKRIDLIRIVSAEISDAITRNKEINDEKVNFINKSYIYLIFGIFMIFIFVNIFFIS